MPRPAGWLTCLPGSAWPATGGLACSSITEPGLSVDLGVLNSGHLALVCQTLMQGAVAAPNISPGGRMRRLSQQPLPLAGGLGYVGE